LPIRDLFKSHLLIKGRLSLSSTKPKLRDRTLFDVIALMDSEVAVVEAPRLQELAARSEIVAAALDWSGVRSFNVISEQVVGVSTRPSTQRVLLLLLELWCQLIVIGQATDDAYRYSLSQSEIGEMAGLSLVSVESALQTLRRNDLIMLEQGEVRFSDVSRCIAFCDFDADFLGIFTPISLAEIDFYLQKRKSG
jgi:hypothetical protein